MFAAKNMHIDMDRIVLSGLLTGMPELSAMLFDFNEVPQSVLLQSKVISGCSREIFHEFILPISLCMLSESYDFTPVEYKEMRSYDLLKSCVGIFLILFIALMIGLNVCAYDKLIKTKDEYVSTTEIVKKEVERNSENLQNVEDEKYRLYYLSQIKSYQKGAFDIYGDLADILDTGDYGKVIFSMGDQDGESAMITGAMNYNSLKDIDDHRHLMEVELKKLEDRKMYRIINSSRYNMDKKLADIKILVEKIK
jgi:hypothetical protein